MNWNRSVYPEKWCEGPLGFPMHDASAGNLERLLKSRPTGKEWDYQRSSAGGSATDFDETDRTDVSVVSSNALDRDQEIVLPAGVDLEQFRKNPIVTFAHRYDLLPVGRALWIKQEGDRLKAKTRYSVRPNEWAGDWLPDAVWHLVQMGDLRGKSIGFLPIDGGPPTKLEREQHPNWKNALWIYRKTLLLEYAVAPVQSNPDAVVEAVAKGLATPELWSLLGMAKGLANWQFDFESESVFRDRLEKEFGEQNLPARAVERLDRRLGRV